MYELNKVVVAGRLCQCPVSGNTHFYVQKLEQVPQGLKECQCPVSGNTHFYSKIGGTDGNYVVIVSMPCVGQHSFLPHPFGNPVFMRVAGPVFARIFQNILITSQNRGQKWAER